MGGRSLNCQLSQRWETRIGKVRHLFHHKEDPIVRNTSLSIVRSMKLRAVSGRHAENVNRRCR